MQIVSMLVKFLRKFRRLIGLVLIPMFLSIAGFLSQDLSQQDMNKIIWNYWEKSGLYCSGHTSETCD